MKVTAVIPVKPVPMIVTEVPGEPEVGVNEVIVGTTVTTKLVVLVPVPAGPVTRMGPVVAVAGTVAVICVAEFTTKVDATPLKVTAVAPVKPVPVITTEVPDGPIVGENDVIPGDTAKSVALVAVPAVLITLILPVVAVFGTVAVILVAELTVNWAWIPLNVTAVMPVKPVPVMVTEVPTGPDAGVNDVIVGATVTVKSVVLVPVPCDVVTVIRPVVAPEGTVVVICVGELTVKAALRPSNLTVIVPEKPVPVSTTDVPTGPLVGVKELITGAPAVTVKFVALRADPLGVVTVILPVVAFAGTVATILVELVMEKVALTPLNRTEVAPVNPVPLIVTDVPVGPLVGVNDVIVGAGGVTVKLELLVAVPSGLTTWIAPVSAAAGTTAVICVLDTTVKLALTPANRTAVVPVKPVPLIVTVVPGGPDVGLNELIVGTAASAAGATTTPAIWRINNEVTSADIRRRAVMDELVITLPPSYVCALV